MVKTSLYSKIASYDFAALFKRKGYAFFTDGCYNLNIIGVRKKNPNNKVTNTFDDYLVVIYNTKTSKGVRRIWSITTEPGLTQMLKPSNAKGTAILVPGQYRGVYSIDLHRGKYKALCQRNGAVSVYRDNNKNDIYDLNPEKIDKGWFGINIHKASDWRKLEYVNNYSAGCQVFKNVEDFMSFMALVNKQVTNGLGNKFTYTLVSEEDLV